MVCGAAFPPNPSVLRARYPVIFAGRPELVASTSAIAKVVRQLSTISDEVYPPLNELVLSHASIE